MKLLLNCLVVTMLLHAKGSLAEKPDPAGGSGLSDDDVLADDQDIVPVDEVAMDEVPESNDGVVVEEDEEDNMVLAGAALRGGGNNKKTDFGLDKDDTHNNKNKNNNIPSVGSNIHHLFNKGKDRPVMKLDKNRRPSFTHQHPKDILNDLLNTEESDIHNLATTAGERKDLGLEDDIMTLLMDHPTLDLTPPPELDKDVATLTAEEGSQLVDFYRNKFEAAVELLGKLDLGSSQGTALFGKFLEVVKKEEPRAVKALKDIAYFMGHQDDKSYEAAAAADQSTNEASDTNAVLALKKKRSDFPRRLLKQESAQQKTYQPETYDQRHLKSRRWNDPAHFAADLPPMFQSQHGRWLLGNGRHAARGLSHGRRRLTKSSQESKQEQCQRLVDCTSSMVKYDLFAFFYSDDIDPTTGKLDDKRVTFDELDINTKYQNMTDILALFFFEYSRGTGYPWQSGDTLRDMFARCVAEHGRGNCEEVRKEEWHTDEMVIVYPKCSVGYNTVGCCTCRAVNHVVGSNEEAFRNCDKLLRLFHRNKENSQNAKWEGGRVDQVCLAQGTNQYIDLGNLIAQRFHMGFDALESVPTFLPTESVPNHLANDYLQDCCFVIADDEVMFQSEGYQYNICQEKLNSIWEDNRMLYSLSYGRLIDIFEQQGVPVGDVKEIKSGYASQSGDYINVGIGGYFGASNARDGSLDTFSHTPDSGAKNSYWELILDPHHILTKITLHGRKGLLDRSTGAQLRMGICDSFCDGHLVANIDYNSTDMIEFQLNPKAGPNIEPGLATWPVRWVRVFKRYDHPNPYVELVEVKLWGVEVPTAAHPHTGRPYPGANWRGDKSKMKKVAQDYAEDLAFENFWKQELNNAFNIAASNFFQSKILEESIYDVVDCSWQLFDSSDRSGNSKFATETFVFGSPGKGEDGFFNNLRIPTQHKRNCGVEAERCSSSKYDNHGQYDPTATGEYFLFKNLTDIYNVEDLTECMDGLVEKVKRDIYDAFKDRMKIYKESMSFSDETNVFQAFFDPTLHDEVESFFYNYFDDFRDKCIQKEVMDVITHGLALIFGEKASPGFVCGIQAKVSQPNGTLPGYCCVDAPWQLNDLDWGHAFQCPEDSKDAQCTNYGPYFSGLSTEACDSYGGTWCPNPQNCTRLKACIEDYIERAETTQHKNAAFAAYLESAPTIDDVTNAEQCGRTREYFGYSALYVNDEDICGNIEQFSYSRDLKFIEEFFSGTSAGNGPDDDLSGPPDLEVPALKVQIEEGEDMIEALLEPLAVLPFVTLKAEPRDGSGAQEVQRGQAWADANYALSTVSDALQFIMEQIAGLFCVSDFPFFIAENVCEGTKSFIYLVFLWIWKAVDMTISISEHMHGIKAEIDNIQPIKTYENTENIYQNMVATGHYVQKELQRLADYNKKIFDTNQDLLHDHHDKINDALFMQHKEQNKALTTHQKDIGDALTQHQKDIGRTIVDHHTAMTNRLIIRFERVEEMLSNLEHKGTFKPTESPTKSPSHAPSKSAIPSELPSPFPSASPTQPPGTTRSPTKEPTLQDTEGLVQVPVEPVSLEWNYTYAEESCTSLNTSYRLPLFEEICANGERKLPTSVEGIDENYAWLPVHDIEAEHSWVNIGTLNWYHVCSKYVVEDGEQVNPAKESPGFFYCFDKSSTGAPSESPSSAPSSGPTSQPSLIPSSKPSRFPSAQPSLEPSSQPTNADCSDLYVCGYNKDGSPKFPMCTIKDNKGEITYESKCKRASDVDGLIADGRFLECGCCAESLEEDCPPPVTETRRLKDESFSVESAENSQSKNQVNQKMSPKIQNNALEAIESIMKQQEQFHQQFQKQFMLMLVLIFGGFFLIMAAVVWGSFRATGRN